MHNVSIVIILSALWLLLSGIYTTMIVGLGFASVLLVIFIVHRMDAQDDDRVEFNLSPFRLVKYLAWLMVEIAKANWNVTKIILAREMPKKQHLFSIPYTQRTDLAQVIFANSITLTAGTITVETEPDRFIVHALAYSDNDPVALADMDARVSATESPERGEQP